MGRKRGSILFIIVLTTVLCLSGCSAKEQKEQNGVCRNLITAVSFVQKMERTDENAAEKMLSSSEYILSPWELQGIQDHVIDWQNPELEMAVRKEINIYDREIWLRDVWNITGLSVVGIKGNLEALGELKNLKNLFLFLQDTTDLSVLAELQNLMEFGFWSYATQDIGVLADLPNLKKFWFGADDIRNIDAIGCLSRLESLDIYGVDSLQDFSFLANLDNLSSLLLYTDGIKDLTPVGNLKRLEKLDIQNAYITDMSPLKELYNLQQIILYTPNVEDIASIKDLPHLRSIVIQARYRILVCSVT